MEFVCKKTTGLSDGELRQITELFEAIFGKERSVEFILRQYRNNVLGYSWHSMIVDKGKIVGLNSYIPAFFEYKGERWLFAASVDSMVSKPYRDFFNYQDMVVSAYEYMRKENVAFVYGYPNDNAYPVVSRSKLMKEIGQMRIWCLPYRIGGLKPGLRFLNPFSRLFSCLSVWLGGCFASLKEHRFLINKDLNTFNKTRYLRADGGYERIGDDREGFVYKVMPYEGIRTAFLIDVFPKSPAMFHRAVRHILKYEEQRFDLMLYVGWLPFGNTGLLKVPIRFEPKKFHFTGKALNPELNTDELFHIENWDTNLSNYDLI
jgi:hypothetical protein